jgi:hypothetical protein
VIRRKLGNTRPGTDVIMSKSVDNVAAVSVGDTSLPVVNEGNLQIITSTDLGANPVITENTLQTLPEQQPATETTTTETTAIETVPTGTQVTETPIKPFPWWLLLVGAGIIYVITRKK